MSVHIYIPVEEVWPFFQQHKKQLEKRMYAVAENEDTGYIIYLTEDKGCPLFSVCEGEREPEYEEGAVNANDCVNTVKKLCVRYLLPVMVIDRPTEDGEDEDEEEEGSYVLTRQDAEDEQYEREDALRDALCIFLDEVCQLDKNTDFIDEFGEEMIDGILDGVLEWLATECGFEVYRPRIIFDDDIGADVFVEYPYNEDMDDGIVIAEDEETEDEEESGGWT